MNSTARRVPRITGLPARTSGSTTIRSEGGIFTVYATNQRRGGCRKLLRSLHRPTFAGGARNPLLRYGRPTSTATSPPESPGAVIALARGLESPPWHYCCDREIQFRSLNSTPSRSWLCSEPRASASGVLTAPNLTVTALPQSNQLPVFDGEDVVHPAQSLRGQWPLTCHMDGHGPIMKPQASQIIHIPRMEWVVQECHLAA